jgi:hypothetical protein
MAKKTSSKQGKQADATVTTATPRLKQPIRDIMNQGGMAPWLAVMVLLIFAGVFAAVRWGGIYLADNPTFNLLIGALIALVGQVGQYYFGSSLGSKQKTRMLEKEMESRDR